MSQKLKENTQNINEVIKKIYRIAPESLKKQLIKTQKGMKFWSTDYSWRKLFECVHQSLDQLSKDENTLEIYSILFDCSKEEVENRFKEISV